LAGSGGPDADDGEEAAALGAFFAIAEEEIAAAGGAEIANEDVGSAEASTEKLGAIGFAEIEEDILGRRLVAWGPHVEPLDGIRLVAGAKFVEPFGGFGELGLKLGGDFGADFVATAADGRADGGEEVRRLCAEVHLHLADGLDDDALEGAPPAGMNGCDGALFGVDEENRNTIGGLDAQEEAGAVGGGGVATARSVGCGVEKMDDVRMDLLEGDELEAGCAEGGLKAEAVLENVFPAVPCGEAKIENFFAVLIRNAAGPCAEAVYEPREFCKGGHLEDSNAARAALGPGSSISGASA